MKKEKWKSIWKQEEEIAHVIEWEFPEFSVHRCMDNLLHMQEILEQDGKIEGTIHRYLIVARKP